MKTERERLEEIREEIRNERVSTSELVELNNLVDHIPEWDTELLEWAGVHEDKEDERLCTVCGDFYGISEFEISDEVCKWCDVTLREEVK